jgi:hypothetical protein
MFRSSKVNCLPGKVSLMAGDLLPEIEMNKAKEHLA